MHRGVHSAAEQQPASPQPVRMSERRPQLGGLGVVDGQIRPGARADLVLVDLDRRWTIEPSAFYTKGRNTPFAGQPVIGKVVETIRAGRVIFREGEERLS